MKIATWNVNSIKARLEPALAWLKAANPDVVCLQEIKCVDENFPRETFESLGYNCAVHGQKSYNGVAILSKRPIEDVTPRLPAPDGVLDEHSRYLEAVITGDKGVVRVGSIYAPNGNPQPGPKFDYKLAWFDRLIDHAHALLESGRPVVLAGDLNVVPTDFDIYNAWAWRFDAVMQPQTRAAYRRLLAQGWIDAHRHLHPKTRIYTYWVNEAAYRRNAGFRMDFVLLSPSLLPRLREAGVDAEHRGREKPSDHAPTWVTLA